MKIYQKALKLQLLYVFLVIVWNVAGLWQKHQGVQTIGPIASIMVIGVALVIVSGLIWMTSRGMTKSYFTLSLFVFLMASMSVYRAFTDDPSWWLSDYWRYLGAAINAIGVASFIVLIRARFKQRHYNQ